MTRRTSSRLDHLDAMTDGRALFEHADGVVPRLEHGYCVDDNARLLVVTSRDVDDGPAARLSRTALAFCLAAIAPDGRSHNRMDVAGRWSDQPSTNDWWGRNLWGLGVASTHHSNGEVRATARVGFDIAARQSSRWPRSMAFASLGAAEVLAADPEHTRARIILETFLAITSGTAGGPWPWPEQRLTYANATLAEATIAAGGALGRRDALDRGLAMLDWLLARESARGHLSVTGVGGGGPHDTGAQFDQQPIEVAAMAEACWRAAAVAGDPAWGRGVALAWQWFEGGNDTGSVMFDDTTGGSYDGLQQVGVNTNQGAESTLALIATRQRVTALLGAPA